MAAGAIPLSEIDAYCRLYGIGDLDDRCELATLIGLMDGEYLAWQAEQQDKRRH
jgi:hypothetical protein